MSARAPRWFARLGAPLGADEHRAIGAYLGALGMPEDAPVRLARTWAEAASLCARPAETWWDTEAAERQRLSRSTELRDDALLEDSETLQRAAFLAAEREGCKDAKAVYAACGAATFAAHDARLARRAGDEDHLFMRKLALYAMGRWPLGVYGGEFAIF